MHLPHDAMLLRIFVSESDRCGHKPLYEALVLKAREMHWPARRCCAGRWVLAKPAGCTRRKFSGFQWTCRS